MKKNLTRDVNAALILDEDLDALQEAETAEFCVRSRERFDERVGFMFGMELDLD